ncbi:MAG: hypothetical protein ACOCXT_05470 [Candidatus Dojkabacteria bacterium]
MTIPINAIGAREGSGDFTLIYPTQNDFLAQYPDHLRQVENRAFLEQSGLSSIPVTLTIGSHTIPNKFMELMPLSGIYPDQPFDVYGLSELSGFLFSRDDQRELTRNLIPWIKKGGNEPFRFQLQGEVHQIKSIGGGTEVLKPTGENFTITVHLSH